MNKPISPDFPKKTPAQKAEWAKYEKKMQAYNEYVRANANKALSSEGKKPSPKPMTYWEKEEKSRDKMDWRNAGFSPAEKKAMAKRNALKKKMGK